MDKYVIFEKITIKSKCQNVGHFRWVPEVINKEMKWLIKREAFGTV